MQRATNWHLPDEAAVTIAGLVIHEAQAIPEPGQRFALFAIASKCCAASATS